MNKNIMSRMRSWSNKNKQFGRMAFQRYVMLLYLDALQKTNSDFIFKGGNLIWHYIKTPRVTVDLDFVTKSIDSHQQVQNELNKVSTFYDDITYKIKEFKRIEKNGIKASAVKIEYLTNTKQKNIFELDIVYNIPTDIKKIRSTVDSNIEYNSSSIENIICDKLQACAKFGTGNTRMKDYDDLWRISNSKIKIDKKKLKELIKKNKSTNELKNAWISQDIEKEWHKHQSQYKDLPADINIIFEDINLWLNNGR